MVIALIVTVNHLCQGGVVVVAIPPPSHRSLANLLECARGGACACWRSRWGSWLPKEGVGRRQRSARASAGGSEGSKCMQQAPGSSSRAIAPQSQPFSPGRVLGSLSPLEGRAAGGGAWPARASSLLGAACVRVRVRAVREKGAVLPSPERAAEPQNSPGASAELCEEGRGAPVGLASARPERVRRKDPNRGRNRRQERVKHSPQKPQRTARENVGWRGQEGIGVGKPAGQWRRRQRLCVESTSPAQLVSEGSERGTQDGIARTRRDRRPSERAPGHQRECVPPSISKLRADPRCGGPQRPRKEGWFSRFSRAFLAERRTETG
jgi:hypothetical protein